jgi:hypothetical protein
MDSQHVALLVARLERLERWRAEYETRETTADLDARLTMLEGAWTDYGGSSTIVGWASFTSQVIQYMRIGKLVIVNFRLDGKSNSTSATFTLPHNSAINTVAAQGSTIDNGTVLTTPGRVSIANGGNVVVMQRDTAGSSFAASSRKGVYGQFWYVTT